MIKFEVWDVTNNPEQLGMYMPIILNIPSHFLVFDITNADSFEFIKHLYISNVAILGGKNFNLSLIGNK